MCATHEAFVLGPPPWLKRQWLGAHDRDGMDLFQRFKRNARPGLVPNGSTVQGVYCMTADGEFLSGYFAWAFKNKAKTVIESGWRRFEQLARTRNWRVQPMPVNRLNHALGKPVPPGGLKLEVAVRDLPRGTDRRPGRTVFQKSAYNVSWVDLTPQDAQHLVTTSKTKTALPGVIASKLSKTMKDCVRGQCADWSKNARRQARLFVENTSSENSQLTMRITGRIELNEDGRAYSCQLLGRVVYDRAGKRFTDFQLLACGQRRGKSKFNDRQDDPGPAPMGVAFSLHR